jgi:hypothetical protein
MLDITFRSRTRVRFLPGGLPVGANDWTQNVLGTRQRLHNSRHADSQTVRSVAPVAHRRYDGRASGLHGSSSEGFGMSTVSNLWDNC